MQMKPIYRNNDFFCGFQVPQDLKQIFKDCYLFEKRDLQFKRSVFVE